ncbi:hypothetical protein QCA50_011364 [Cerrena zonata]|uniref:Uncharacterized protein n=1 Tax=Cerrena zonata TaxID=2478898 RepID=A0AAW0FWD7_9APHY
MFHFKQLDARQPLRLRNVFKAVLDKVEDTLEFQEVAYAQRLLDDSQYAGHGPYSHLVQGKKTGLTNLTTGLDLLGPYRYFNGIQRINDVEVYNGVECDGSEPTRTPHYAVLLVDRTGVAAHSTLPRSMTTTREGDPREKLYFDDWDPNLLDPIPLIPLTSLKE